MPFNRPAFLQAVFAPRADERVLVLVDQRTDNCPDHPDWQARRAMAPAWGQVLAALGADYLGMLTYPATGANNGDLPAHGLLHGRPVAMAQSLAAADLVLALTEYSATAPLLAAIRASGGRLRAASLPGVLPRMETTALTVDVPRLARRVAYLRAALDQAVGAQLVFSTGHQVYFDLRHRQAHGDDGRLP
ncbi:MAG: hypothetical protein K9N49_10365, partial [Candidatus Marinimicrobia bacterium]|nr:hypothetical protein [Candidatus Neomarinimicrobiota bacterium]